METIHNWEPEVMLSSLPIDTFEVGQNLKTLNGRLGNCLIIGKEVDYFGEEGYILLTDFGNKVFVAYSRIPSTFDLENTCVFVVDVVGRIDKQIELLKNAKDRIQNTLT